MTSIFEPYAPPPVYAIGDAWTLREEDQAIDADESEQNAELPITAEYVELQG